MGDEPADYGAGAKSKLAPSLKEKKAKGGPARPSDVNNTQEYAPPKERVVRDVVSSVTEKKVDPVKSPVKRPIPKAESAPKDEDDYGDDDFEDYADEFEEDTPSPAPAKVNAAQTAAELKQSSKPLSRVGGPATLPGKEPTSVAAAAASAAANAPARQDSTASADAKVASNARDDGTSRVKSSASRSGGQTAGVASTGSGNGSSSSSGSSGSGARRAKKFGAVNMSLDAATFRGPRAKRLQRLYASGVLDMQEEKFTLFSLPSSTPLDHYHRQLRPQSSGQQAPLRQFGVPAEDESRSVEVATDDIERRDKGVQFCYGDDTQLLNIMESIKNAKEAKAKGIRLTAVESESMADALRTGASQRRPLSGDEDATASSSDNSAGTRLTSFLQRASVVCERLLDEERSGRLGGQDKQQQAEASSAKYGSLFKEGSAWVELGTSANGANELVRSRAVAAMHFSPLQPHLLCTAHPFLPGDEEDLAPFKGVYCIWDLNSPAEPTYVLSASGQPTACAFSASQTFLVVAGTSEGTLHAWDLRESSAIHRDRDSTDLGIEKGIRKPCYSSPLSLQGLSLSMESEASRKDDYGVAKSATGSQSRGVDQQQQQHTAPITQITCLGDADPVPAAVSQFASIDQSGLVCLWVSSQREAGSDSGLSPWGRVVLTVTRALNVASPSPSPSRGHPAGNSRGGLWDFDLNGSSSAKRTGPVPVMSAIPGDASTLLVAGDHGVVSKVVRFGEAPAPQSLDRSAGSCLEIAFQGRSGKGKSSGGELRLYSDVTCIAVQRRVQPAAAAAVSASASSGRGGREEAKADAAAAAAAPAVAVDEAQLVLVGRADGSVDLFRTDVSAPLQSWSIDAGASKSKDKTGSKDKDRGQAAAASQRPSIVSVRWLPNSMTSFQAVDSKGSSYVHNLLTDANNFLCADKLPSAVKGGQGQGQGQGLVSDVSRCRFGSNAAYMAVGSAAPGGRVQVRSVWEGWLRSTASDGPRLMEQLPTWSLRTTVEKGRLHLVDPLSPP